MLRAAALVLAGLASAAAADTPVLTDAWYEVPSDLYPHRIMGDIREKLVLAARDDQGREYRVDLRDTGADHNVFEDIAPRVTDADGDGTPDLVVVESAQQAGAQLAIYSLRGQRLVKSAATPHIGTRFRWLAPVAIADLDGDGVTDLAYVDRPHLAKTLRVWSWAPGGLTQIAERPGLTNHRIGEEFISGGLRDCGAGPEMITADAGWRQVMASRLIDGDIESRAIGAFDGPDSFTAALACE